MAVAAKLSPGLTTNAHAVARAVKRFETLKELN
jgi:hypothetical protein